MENLYSRLLQPLGLVVAEEPSTYYVFTERHLQALWLEQQYFKELITTSNKSVQVVSPGIWNHAAGPDFLKAHLRVDGRDFIGDVEVHLSSEDWYAHKHDKDERYNGVILHVSLWTTNRPRPIFNQKGQEISQIHLESFLTLSLDRITARIDLDLYPYHQYLGSGQCAQRLFRTLPNEKIIDFFRKASTWRLFQKFLTLQAHSDQPKDMFKIGIAMSLGYKHNTNTFIHLFHWLMKYTTLGEENLFILSLNACGFFKKHYVEKWGHSPQYRYYHALHLMLSFSLEHVPQFPLELHHIRPFNHPIRRLVCLAKVLTDRSLSNLLEQMLNHWSLQWSQAQDAFDWNRLRQQLIDLLPNYEDPYWNQHFLFEEKPKVEIVTLLGGQIKQEILTNTFMPLLFQQIDQRNEIAEIQAFQKFFSGFPATHTSKTRYLQHRFFGNTPRAELVQNADIEQGAYQLHRDFCLHYESSCEGCPFIDRYIKYF